MSKEKRDRLFKRGRPVFRPLQVFDGDKYHRDVGIIWASHSKAPFTWIDDGTSKEGFIAKILELGSDRELLVADDKCDEYSSGEGPVGLVTVISPDGWRIEPHVQFFSWATPRNKLSVCVSFFQWARYKRGVKSCVVRSTDESVALFDKCCEYGVLSRVGKIPDGNPYGDETIYYVRCNSRGRK